ncbi:hypothetical protein LTR84_011887 [Exophiala bonariae]|uniref:Uncharacterized protein n=1 Tax=Exophiala bonariae TaxID=1690606 RepID=A0AAV9NKX9_9EURO|nr:hypothetical protein LTR84_011887 [Exophiala bonariae]
MPTILTAQGWVKVAESPTKRRTVAIDPAENLKGPLAYFSCKRTPPKVFPGVLHLPTGGKGTGAVKGPREAFPYDLNASPEKLRAQGRLKHNSQIDKVKIGGKNRTVSAPMPVMHMDDCDDAHAYYSDEDGAAEAGAVVPPPRSSRRRESPVRSSSPSPSSAAIAAARAATNNPRSSRHTDDDSKPHSRHHHHKSRHHHHHDDASSVSSRSTASSTSSYHSHHSHERARPVQAAPQPIIMYATAPPPMPSSYYNNPYDSGPRHAHARAPPSTGGSSARSMSYSWYNATTPLNL